MYGKKWRELSYDNPIVAIETQPFFNNGLNIIFKDGSHGGIIWNKKCDNSNIERTDIPDHSIFSRVELLYSKSRAIYYGLNFYDVQGKLVFRVGNTWRDADILDTSIIL